MWVKICGISTMRAAVAAVEAGADAVGFIFAPARRQITPQRAESMIRGLPGATTKVGVFVDEDPETMIRIARESGLTHLQLHGTEPPELIESLPYPVIKAFRVRSPQDLQLLPAYRMAAGLLLEPYVEGQPGGTGHSLNWSVVRESSTVLKQAGIDLCASHEPLQPGKPKLILAGGLTATTVAEAVREAQPGGVDVSSGVETDGRKDIDKIYAFLEMAKEAML